MILMISTPIYNQGCEPVARKDVEDVLLLEVHYRRNNRCSQMDKHEVKVGIDLGYDFEVVDKQRITQDIN